MRYYMYLDRCFLRTLFSVVDDFEFNIEVIEYSVINSCSTKNGICLDPCIESICNGENGKEYKEEELFKKEKQENLKKEKIGVSYDSSKTYNTQTERKYINIQDITEMKNSSFYHHLIERIKDTSRDSNSSICMEYGYIKPQENRDTYKEDKTNQFFMINNSYVWFDSKLLDADIFFLSNICCKVHVVGYTINCDERKEKKILKAIAIYID